MSQLKFQVKLKRKPRQKNRDSTLTLLSHPLSLSMEGPFPCSNPDGAFQSASWFINSHDSSSRQPPSQRQGTSNNRCQRQARKDEFLPTCSACEQMYKSTLSLVQQIYTLLLLPFWASSLFLAFSTQEEALPKREKSAPQALYIPEIQEEDGVEGTTERGWLLSQANIYGSLFVNSPRSPSLTNQSWRVD